MIHTKERVFSVKVLPNPQIITPDAVIDTLRGICEQRFHAYNAVPATASSLVKFRSIEIIRAGLKHAKRQIYWREKLRICIKLEPYLKEIAIRTNERGYANYMHKLNTIMAACNEAIGWRVDA